MGPGSTNFRAGLRRTSRRILYRLGRHLSFGIAGRLAVSFTAVAVLAAAANLFIERGVAVVHTTRLERGLFSPLPAPVVPTESVAHETVVKRRIEPALPGAGRPLRTRSKATRFIGAVDRYQHAVQAREAVDSASTGDELQAAEGELESAADDVQKAAAPLAAAAARPFSQTARRLPWRRAAATCKSRTLAASRCANTPSAWIPWIRASAPRSIGRGRYSAESLPANPSCRCTATSRSCAGASPASARRTATTSVPSSPSRPVSSPWPQHSTAMRAASNDRRVPTGSGGCARTCRKSSRCASRSPKPTPSRGMARSGSPTRACSSSVRYRRFRRSRSCERRLTRPPLRLRRRARRPSYRPSPRRSQMRSSRRRFPTRTCTAPPSRPSPPRCSRYCWRFPCSRYAASCCR